jgi:hypothetical protein
MANPPFQSEAVAARFADYPETLRKRLLELRRLIFRVARENEAVGPLEETLKWNQPAYLPSTTRSGTTVRISAHGQPAGEYALYVHCNTDLLDRFRQLYHKTLRLEGKRAIVFRSDESLPDEAVAHCIELALTYHLK